jgi:hypothetical protein
MMAMPQNVDAMPSNEVYDTDDDCSYEEIIIEDEDEYIEEILCHSSDSDSSSGESGSDSDSDSFTEVTYESDDNDANFIMGGDDEVRRSVIKTAAQKALEGETARIAAQEEEACARHKFALARQKSFSRRNDEGEKKLEDEEEEAARNVAYREKVRMDAEAREARLNAEEAAARISIENEEDRKKLEGLEALRKAEEESSHRAAAEAAALQAEGEERLRRIAADESLAAAQEEKARMREMIRQVEADLEAARLAKKNALEKEEEQKKALKAKIKARKRETKEKLAQLMREEEEEAAELAKAREEQVLMDRLTKAKEKLIEERAKEVQRITEEADNRANTQQSEQDLLQTRLLAAKAQLAMAKEKEEMEEQGRNAACSVPDAAPATASQKTASSKPAAAPATASPAPPSSSSGVESTTDEMTTYYRATELRKEEIPGLDYKNREKYLSPEEFKSLFKYSKEVYAAMPKWKQTKEKRKVKMF